MKQILILSCSALAFSVAAAHAGDGNLTQLEQVGDYNSVTTTQTGDGNIAGGNSNFLLDGKMIQNGDWNNLAIVQRGNGSVHTVRQTGNENDADIDQAGTGSFLRELRRNRVALVEQSAPLGGSGSVSNKLTVKQKEQGNWVGVVRQNNPDGGAQNTASIEQKGSWNGSLLAVPYLDPARLEQDGAGNTTTVVQNGDANNFRLLSTGDNNDVDLLQKSDGSYARNVFVGDGNTANLDQAGADHWMDIEVNGGNGFLVTASQADAGSTIDYVGDGTDGRIYFEQHGDGNTISANSSGTDQHIAFRQKGGGNNITVAALRGTAINKLYFDQKSADNNILVGTVDGEYNRLQFIQKGGSGNEIDMGDVIGNSNKLFFTQDGEGNLIEASVGDEGVASGNSNEMEVMQKGNDNIVTAHVLWGDNNQVRVGQKGDNNSANVSQAGNNNSATIMQGAASVTLPVITAGAPPFPVNF